MERTGGTNTVSHCAIPAHGFLPSTRFLIASFKPLVMKWSQSTFSPSYVAITKPALYFGMARGRGCTNPYSIIVRATSPNSRFCPPCIRYALLPREYSPKYSNMIWLEGHSTDRNPPACSPVSACTAPSVISDRSMVVAACSGSACGGALAMHRSPSNLFSVNHCLAYSESAMGHVSSSWMSWSV